MIEVELPNGSVAEFPDGMSNENIQAVLQKQFGGAPRAEGQGVMSKVGNFFTGESRKTDQTESLPELRTSAVLTDENKGHVLALTPAMLTTTNSDEIASIVSSNFPHIKTVYNKDGEGNVIPILVNTKNGAKAIINKPGISGMDVFQTLGLMAAFTPAGRAGTLTGAAVKSGLTEAGIQSTQAASGGEFNPLDVVLSSALGGALPAVANLAKGGYSLIKGSGSSQITKEAEEAGVRALTSDVLPPKTFAGKTAQQTAEKIPLVGTAGLREAQQKTRVEAVERVAQKYQDFSYSEIVKSLRAQKNRIKNRAGNVLETTGRQLDEAGEIPLTATKEALEEVGSALNKQGVIRSEGALADLKVLTDALSESPQTFTSLKENRTQFRDLIKGLDKAERSQLGSRANAQMMKIVSALTEDMESFAKTHLDGAGFSKWKRANSVYADEAQKLTRTKLKNILDKGDQTPETVQRLLFSKNQSELSLLNSSLTPAGRAHARSAIITKVVDGVSSRQSGFTPNSFATELGKYSKQVDTFFKGAEKKQLEGLRRVLNATRRAQDSAVTTPTGQQLIGALSIGGLAMEPTSTVLATGTLGGLARLYESPPVRSALLRLASAPEGSAQFSQALDQAQKALASAAQTLRSQQSDTR